MMKVSKLIRQLEAIQETYGDIEDVSVKIIGSLKTSPKMAVSIIECHDTDNENKQCIIWCVKD